MKPEWYGKGQDPSGYFSWATPSPCGIERWVQRLKFSPHWNNVAFANAFSVVIWEIAHGLLFSHSLSFPSFLSLQLTYSISYCLFSAFSLAPKVSLLAPIVCKLSDTTCPPPQCFMPADLVGSLVKAGFPSWKAVPLSCGILYGHLESQM